MEEVRELKSVLERVEGKLIVAEKTYAALNFAVWLTIMVGYYILMGVFGYGALQSITYWLIAASMAVYITGKVWDRYIAIYTAKEDGGKKVGLMILASWVIGSIIGWGIIPRTDIAVNVDARIAVGLLSFIGLSLLGQTLALKDREAIPSFLIPLLAVPVAWNMETGATVWAGFVIAAGFGLTIVLYLYSAFRAIER